MNVQIPTDQRINMSLDDLIKSRNQQQKKKPAAAANNNSNTRSNTRSNSGKNGNAKKQVRIGGAANAASRPNSANSAAKRTRTPRQNNSNNNSAMDVDVRMAKSVGAGRANRNAQMNARRGLSASPVATKQAVRKEVNKQLQKKRPGSANSAKSAPAAANVPAGLKISFRPGELAKTTEKVVTQQIKAVLARQGSPRAAGGNNNNNGGTNTVGRNGPKARGKKVLRVVH